MRLQVATYYCTSVHLKRFVASSILVAQEPEKSIQSYQSSPAQLIVWIIMIIKLIDDWLTYLLTYLLLYYLLT